MNKLETNRKGRRTFQQNLGSYGEQLACQFYLDHGYEFVERNVFVGRIGEIDLIVSRSVSGTKEFVFVEVKTRSSQSFGYGYESIDERKLSKMRRCAMQWIVENSKSIQTKSNWRIDVVSIDKNVEGFKIKVFSSV